MSLSRRHFGVLTSWFVALVVLLGMRIAFGATVLPNGLDLLFLFLVPATIFLAVFRGAPPITIAQVLYDAEHVTRAGVRSVRRPGNTQ